VTDEALDVVEKWYATKKKTIFPLVIDHGGLEKMIDVPHFPYSGVIDPSGNLIYAGDSPESALKKAMATAKPGSIWPKKVANTAALIRNGKLVDAWADLQSVKTGGALDEKEQAAFDRLAAYLTEVTSGAVKSADELAKANMVRDATLKLEAIAGAKPALPCTPDAQKLLAELKALPTYDDEIKGGELFAAAAAKEDARDYLGAALGYRDVARKFEKSKIAGVAMEHAKDLVSRGMPGYEKSCDKCRKGQKACDKHAKPVKL